jgi:hypothetical protein
MIRKLPVGSLAAGIKIKKNVFEGLKTAREALCKMRVKD